MESLPPEVRWEKATTLDEAYGEGFGDGWDARIRAEAMETARLQRRMRMENDGMAVNVGHVSISETAADAIRFRFNPSQMDEVAKIKTLTGGLITRLEDVAHARPETAELVAAAIDKVITASMWSVLAATKGL